MSQALVTLPDGRKARVTFDTKEQLDATVNDLVSHAQPAPQAPQPEQLPHGEGRDALYEPILNVATSAVATPVAGLAGLASTAYNAIKEGSLSKGLEAGADTVRNVQSAMTYEPKTEMGQQATNVVTYPFRKLSEGADWLGGKTTDVATSLGASPEVAAGLGATVNAGVQLAVPTAVAKGVKAVSAVKPVAANPEIAAKKYVSDNTNLDWNSITDKTREALTSIAQDSQRLDALDPQAVERQARLDALEVPYTRGQVTRDLPQLTREENITKSDAGQPVRDINAAQDSRLHQIVDKLREQTGAKAETRQAIGTSVQDAARSKEAVSKGKYNALYSKARATEPDATVSAAPMSELLKDNPEIQHLGFVKTWLDKAKLTTTTPEVPPSAVLDSSGKPMTEGAPATTETRGVKLVELDDLRKKAQGIAKGGGDNAYYAGEVVKAIDKAFDNVPVASKAWRDARDAFKAHKIEFEDQAAVDKLVGNKSRTDRNTALEDTFDQVVLKGSAEDIGKVKKSLLSGDPGSVVKGAQAWKDVQGATLDYLKEKAAGRRAIVGEKNQLQFNSTFRDAFNELEKDGKIDAIFTPAQAKLLRQLNDAVGDVRTKPTGRVAGSDTTPRILATLEKISKIPVVGHLVSGSVKAGMMVSKIGAEARTAAEATRTPLDEGASQVTSAAEKEAARRRSVRRIAPYAPGTQTNRN